MTSTLAKNKPVNLAVALRHLAHADIEFLLISNYY